MSIMASIKSLLGMANVITTGCTIAEKTTDGIIAGLDKINYTEEEKADTRIMAGKAIVESYQRFNNENSQQSKARRDIAWAFVYMYAGILFIGVLLIVLGEADKLRQMKDWISILGLSLAMGSIIVTYFTPYQLSKLGILKGKK